MKQPATRESVVREIKQRTRKKCSREEKIRIVLEELRGEASIAELCRREGFSPNIYFHEVMAVPQAGQRVFRGRKETSAGGHGT